MPWLSSGQLRSSPPESAVGRVLASIQDIFENDSFSIDIICSYGRCQLLVFDDLGKEPESNWSVSTIFQIIDMHYGALPSAVITSRYPYSGLIDKFSKRGDEKTAPAIVPWLKETCEFVDREPAP